MDGVNYSTDSSAYVGLGIGADLNKHFNIQANYLHLSGSGGDPDRDAVQVGLEYRF
jgi:outer membrane autotransporter protein